METVPHAVVAIAGGRAIERVWTNELGGMTFAIGESPAREFVKWTPARSPIDPDEERVRLAWALRYTTRRLAELVSGDVPAGHLLQTIRTIKHSLASNDHVFSGPCFKPPPEGNPGRVCGRTVARGKR